MASTVTCGYSDANWEINSEGENACEVYAELQGKCNSTFVIRSATASSPPYTPPNNPCGCNIVAYNLMGGCAWCQTGLLTGWWLTIDQWVGNCTEAQFNPSRIPSTVSTAGINFPEWALVIPSGTTWSPSQASRAAVSATPSLSTSSSSTASPTGSGTSSPGFTFSTDRSISRPSGGDSFGLANYYQTNAGAAAGIAIGVIAGIWLLTLIAVGVVYFRRQTTREAWYRPMAAFYQGQKNGYGGPDSGGPPLYPGSGSPHGEGFPAAGSPSSGGAYYPSTVTTPPGHNTAYVPPPPVTNYSAPQGAQGPPIPGAPAGWGGPAGNTASVYGGSSVGYGPNTVSVYGSQTALAAASGMGGPPGGVPPGAPGAQQSQAAGYRGHAEVY